jgi:hypothetical protein
MAERRRHNNHRPVLPIDTSSIDREFDTVEDERPARSAPQVMIQTLVPSSILSVDFLGEKLDLESLEIREYDGIISKSVQGIQVDSSRFHDLSLSASASSSAPPLISLGPPTDPRLLGYIPVLAPKDLRQELTSKETSKAKFLLLLKQEFAVNQQEIFFEVVAGTNQIFKGSPPFPKEFRQRIRNIQSDYRLCSGGPMLYEPNLGLELGFLDTNQAIYIFYGRHTIFHSTKEVTGARFAAVNQVLRKGSSHRETHKFTIGVSPSLIRWYLDDHPVFEVSHIGHRLLDRYQVLEHGGEASILKPQSFKFGFGHFTFLDHQLPQSTTFIDRDTDPTNVTFRSETGLCMLEPELNYREVLPDIMGQQGPILPRYTFATTSDHSRFRYFDQGVCSVIASMTVYRRRIQLIPTQEPILAKSASISASAPKSSSSKYDLTIDDVTL